MTCARLSAGFFAASVLVFAPTLAVAHGTSKSYAEWAIEGTHARARIAFAGHDLTAAIEGLDADGDGALSATELAARADRLAPHIAEGLALVASGEGCPYATGAVRGLGDPVEEVQVQLDFACPGLITGLKVQGRLLPVLEPPHVSVATFTGRGLDATHVFTAQSPAVELAVEPPSLSVRLGALAQAVPVLGVGLLLALGALAIAPGRWLRAGLFVLGAGLTARLGPPPFSGALPVLSLVWLGGELVLLRRRVGPVATARRAAWALLSGAAAGWGVGRDPVVDTLALVAGGGALLALAAVISALGAARPPPRRARP